MRIVKNIVSILTFLETSRSVAGQDTPALRGLRTQPLPPEPAPANGRRILTASTPLCVTDGDMGQKKTIELNMQSYTGGDITESGVEYQTANPYETLGSITHFPGEDPIYIKYTMRHKKDYVYWDTANFARSCVGNISFTNSSDPIIISVIPNAIYSGMTVFEQTNSPTPVPTGGSIVGGIKAPAAEDSTAKKLKLGIVVSGGIVIMGIPLIVLCRRSI